MTIKDSGKRRESTAYGREYYAKHREYLNERRRESYKKNPKRYSGSRRQYYFENLEKAKESSKKSQLNRAGWTSDMFEATLQEQGNRCAICRLPMGRACADHKHVVPPEPRGVLCHSCNTAIGHFRENPETMRSAADYIEGWS